LLERGTFKVLLHEEIRKNAPVMKGRFVSVIQNRDTNQEVYKARYVFVGSVGQLIKIAMLRVKNALPFLEC
jgi:hypothetical protein